MMTMMMMMMRRRGAEKSMELRMCLTVAALVLSVASASANSDMNNSLNPYSSSNGTMPATSSSTAQSMLETYLQTFPINEQQSILTTVHQTHQQHHTNAAVEEDKEKTTAINELTSSVGSSSSSSSSVSSSTTRLASLSTESSSSDLQTPVVVVLSSGQPPLTPSLTPPSSVDGEQTPIIDEPPHEPLGCGPNTREVNGIQKALDWLREKRIPTDYGWDNDTHFVILAKELSNGREPNDIDGNQQKIYELEDFLSVKQMEIDILDMLDKHHSATKPVDTDRLARYIMALSALCKDTRRFHSHDLVQLLQHHEPTQDDEFALAALAACSSAAHVRKRQIRRLLDIASGEITNVDTMAMVLLALRCIITDHRHRHLQHFIRRPALGLAALQGPRGSFGSLRSTALAMQALQDLPLDGTTYNRTASSKWILDRQRSDGGWTEEPIQDGQEANIGIGLTADITLALGCKGLGAVRALQCDHVPRPNGNGVDGDGNGDNGYHNLLPLPPSSNEDTELKNVTYTYTLWLESNITEIFSLQLVSPKNTSFFKAMTQAADQDSRFSFEAREWPNGHYIHTLAGKKEEPTSYHYWLLYRLPESPDPESPPGNQLIAPVGVDELMVEDGEHYLYWYKKL